MAVMVFTSCSKDDPKEDLTEDQKKEVELVGTWLMTDYDYDLDQIASGSGVTFSIFSTGVITESDFEMEFSGDPNTFETRGSYTFEVAVDASPYIWNGQELFEAYSYVDYATISDYEITGDWSVQEGMLKGLTLQTSDEAGGQQSADYEITKLTNEELELSFVAEQTIMDQGATMDIVVDGVLIFERVE